MFTPGLSLKNVLELAIPLEYCVCRKSYTVIHVHADIRPFNKRNHADHKVDECKHKTPMCFKVNLLG